MLSAFCEVKAGEVIQDVAGPGTGGKLSTVAVSAEETPEILVRSRRTLGEDHPRALTAAANLVANLRALGEHETVAVRRN